jgi:DNA-binding CsgD family transcriptional regulator/tetratricopeptide (TPR) repeat protein
MRLRAFSIGVAVPDRLIGRGSELAVLDRFLRDLATHPGAVLVAGEAGIGKTVLWKAASGTAADLGHQVLAARPAESETSLPFAGLADLLEGVAEPVLRELPAPQRRALEVALLSADDGGRPVDQRTLSVAVLGTLRLLAAAGPVVVAVDDVQWLDPPSARVLQFVVRRLGDAPVGLLLSLRTEPGSGDPLDLGRALPEERLVRLPLGPLSVGALHQMVAARLDVHLSHSVVVRLHQASAGIPFFALELARALGGGGATLKPGRPLPVPEDLRSLVRGRFQSLSADARRAVLVIAAAHQPSAELVGAVLGPGAKPGLAEAASAGVLEVESTRLRLAHPLLGSTAYLEAGPDERHTLHAALARVAVDPAERARHLALASDGPDAQVAAALEEAATIVAGRGAPDAAADLAEQASDLTPDSDRDRHRRMVAAAGYHFCSGDLVRARTLLEHVVTGSGPGEDRAGALRLLGEVRYYGDSIDAAIPLLRQALDEGGSDPQLVSIVELDLALALVQSGKFLEGQPHAHAALRSAERLGRPGLVAQALAVVVVVDFLVGAGLDTDRLERALANEEHHYPSVMWMRPAFVAPIVRMWMGRLDEARAGFAALRDDLAEHGEEASLPMMGIHAVHTECLAGDLRVAAAHADASMEASLEGGAEVARACAFTAQAMVHAHTGDADVARRQASEAVASFRRAGFPMHVVWPLRALGVLELSLGDVAAAHGILGPLTDVVTASGLAEPGGAPYVPDEIEALVGLGHLDAAGELLDWLDERGSAHDRPWALATAGRCRALLLAARGDLDGAMAAVDAALVQHQRVPMPLERARTLLVKGQLHRRRKEKRAAKETLTEALDAFERSGAALWADRVRHELDRVGLRPAAPLDLTPTEARVAELAGAGLATRTIAERLFMSSKTVEGVLGRVYRKLGVHSRAELATTLAGSADSAGAS